MYNAVNGSHYTDETAIEINTIKEVLYLGMHKNKHNKFGNTLIMLPVPKLIVFYNGLR